MNNGTSYNLHYHVGLVLSLVVWPLTMETTHTGSLKFSWAHQVSYLKAAGVHANRRFVFLIAYTDKANWAYSKFNLIVG